MTKIIKLAFTTTLFLGSSLALACDYPDRPSMPDGSTASKDELLAAKTAVQTYVSAVDEYLTCIESEENETIAALDNPSQEELQRRNDMINKKFDAANEEKAMVGEQFNQQIRAYNKKVQDAKE
jgi:hypothetical protein